MERGAWSYQEQSEEKKLNGRGWKREDGVGARSGRGSGLPAAPLIKRFSGALMGLVRENYQGEGLGMLCPLSSVSGWGPRV